VKIVCNNGKCDFTRYKQTTMYGRRVGYESLSRKRGVRSEK